ncbi:hypothetical protein D9M68_949730 [compost metagenome]
MHATELYELKVTDAVPETIEASLQLSQAVLVGIGIPMGVVIASIHEKRDEFRKMLQPTDGSDRERHAIRAPQAKPHLTYEPRSSSGAPEHTQDR